MQVHKQVYQVICLLLMRKPVTNNLFSRLYTAHTITGVILGPPWGQIQEHVAGFAGPVQYSVATKRGM